jgi:hypothetical protein
MPVEKSVEIPPHFPSIADNYRDTEQRKECLFLLKINAWRSYGKNKKTP